METWKVKLKTQDSIFMSQKPNSFMLWDIKSCLKGQVETVNLHLSGTVFKDNLPNENWYM